MVYKNRKELAEAVDGVIHKFISLNYPISDTDNEHTLMVFILKRKGYKLIASSPTRRIASASVPIDDVFSIDEHLQELDTLCIQSINNSKRYKVIYD